MGRVVITSLLPIKVDLRFSLKRYIFNFFTLFLNKTKWQAQKQPDFLSTEFTFFIFLFYLTQKRGLNKKRQPPLFECLSSLFCRKAKLKSRKRPALTFSSLITYQHRNKCELCIMHNVIQERCNMQNTYLKWIINILTSMIKFDDET